MYTIGEFSLIAEVSTKTLRHYDDFGLFKPFKIDESNNYRYYSKEQIEEIMFIKQLKRYGLSLSDIKEIKELNNKEFLNSILEKQLMLIDKKITSLKDMKVSIEKKIEEATLWTKDDEKINYVINKIYLKPSKVVFIRKKIKLEEIGELIGHLYGIVNEFSAKLKSNHMIIIHNRYENEIADVEVFAFAEKLQLIDEDYKSCFEGGMFLRTTHNGFNDKANAYAMVYDFAKENNYKLVEPVIEKYEMNSGRFTVDIMFKIR